MNFIINMQGSTKETFVEDVRKMLIQWQLAHPKLKITNIKVTIPEQKK